MSDSAELRDVIENHWTCHASCEPYEPECGDVECDACATRKRMLALIEPASPTLASDLIEAVGLLKELHAIVMGECPSLLDGDRGGSGEFAVDLDAFITRMGET